jgi:N-acetylmuramoyl-L-alanine amidase
MYELAHTIAPAALIEIAFHDNLEDAKWIMSNIKIIGTEIAKGILDYLEIKYQQPENVPVKPPVFNDLNKISDTAKPSVLRLEELKIIAGDKNNNFNPCDKMTRQEIAVMIDKTLKILGK